MYIIHAITRKWYTMFQVENSACSLTHPMIIMSYLKNYYNKEIELILEIFTYIDPSRKFYGLNSYISVN